MAPSSIRKIQKATHAPPRKRGWPVEYGFHVRRRSTLPARAGMARSLSGTGDAGPPCSPRERGWPVTADHAAATRGNAPRASGVGPSAAHDYDSVTQCSPRERG